MHDADYYGDGQADFPTEGHRVIAFIQKFCRLVGSHAGQPFRLARWQKQLLLDAYRLDQHGQRQHRTCVVCVARKNGKSTLAAAIMLYHLVADRADAEPQVIAAANDRNQARMVFDAARKMVLSSPELSRLLIVHRDSITNPRNGGTYRVVSADAGRQQGLNVSACSLDEYAFARNADLFDALTLGSAARNQPMFWVISTAGPDPDGEFAELCAYGRRVNSGEITDPSFFYRSWGPLPDEEVEHTDPAVWRACNPAYPILNADDFKAAVQRTSEAAFRIYRLSQFVRGGTTWLPHGTWKKLLKSEGLEPGDEIVVGADGSWRSDSTALVACRVRDRHLVPIRIWEAPRNDPDWRVPLHEVKAVLEEVCRTYRVVEIAADPYRWEQTLQEMSDEGLPVVEFPTSSLARMIPATQTFTDAARDGHLSHDGSAVLARHVANAILKEDHRGGRISKEFRSSKRFIDAAVAAVIAHHRALFYADPGEPELLILAS
ncbi:terminase large subunit domain-containing protein [Crossiella sp. CA198]|uniref:terminase large subunit domain-containing protein n=1 Tax=Crossiella sp. CA198 TaxID=3455607 RepID=UPI003F8D2A70